MKDTKMNIIQPYGGKLVDLIVRGEEKEELKKKTLHMKSLQIPYRFVCDLEMLATGAFSPLTFLHSRGSWARKIMKAF